MFNEFTTCPQSFYDKYILNKVEAKRSSALEFGKALHLAIQTHFEGGDAVGVFQMYWNTLKDIDMIYYRYDWQALHDMTVNKFLPNFIKRHANKFTNIKMEQELSMPFLGEHTLQGTYDMLSDYEGILTLSDWKTSSSEYPNNKLEKSPQLYIYAALCNYNYGKLPEQLQYKVFIKSEGRIQTLKRTLTLSDTTATIAEVERIAKVMLHMIETKEFYHTFDCYCRRSDVRHTQTA